MIDLKRAKRDPAGVFDHPDDVVANEDLTREEKLEMLQRWRYDALQQEVAQEENMQRAAHTLLSDIVTAMSRLGYRPGDGGPPTKVGGA